MRFFFNNDRLLNAEEFKHATARPDLPPCERCDSGTKCSCEVYGYVGPCACLGFTGCPECPRGRAEWSRGEYFKPEPVKEDGFAEFERRIKRWLLG